MKEMKQKHLTSSQDVHVFINEKYFARTANYILTVIIAHIIDEENCNLNIIVGGGKHGAFEITLGAEKKRIDEIIQLMQEIIKSNSWSFSII